MQSGAGHSRAFPRDQPVFLCGIPRSGTSLLLSLLDGHSSLAVAAAEAKFFTLFLPEFGRAKTFEERIEVSLRSLLLIWFDDGDYYKRFLSTIRREDLFETFESLVAGGPQTPAHYLECSIEAYCALSGQLDSHRSYWVEKTPWNEHHAWEIFRTWPRAKCVHVLRDPRDVLATYQRRDRHQGRPVSSVTAVAHAWRRSALSASTNLVSHPQQYLLIRYEDLVLEPAATMKAVVGFLDIPFEELLLEPTRCAGSVDWSGNAVGESFQGISASRLGRWREECETSDLRLLEALVAAEAAEFGYSRELEIPEGFGIRTILARSSNTLRRRRDAARRALARRQYAELQPAG